MKTAILIDDDQVQRDLLASWLAEAGWQVLSAEDGERGMELFRQNRPDIVVCELLMSRCNGFQLCRMIRQEDGLGGTTKIIVTAGGGYATDRINALEAGADEYLVKPIAQRDLLKLVSQLMGDDWETVRQERQRTVEAATTRIVRPLIGPALPMDEPAKVRFWGVRGSIATPGPATLRYGGNTACVEVRADGELIICDAGTGIARLGAHLNQEFRGRPFAMSLLISHTHWDHIQGFPFFEPAYNPSNHLRIFGFKGAREGLDIVLSQQMESPYFPIGMAQMPGNIVIEELRDSKFNIGRVSVETTFLNHPGTCIGYRINTSCGAIAYLADNEPYQRYKYHTGGTADAKTQEAVEYARRQDQRLIDFVTGCQVLVIDSQYDATEYQTRIGWGHGCIDDVVALALSAKVKQLFLFHHDPKHNDEHIDQMVEWARNFVLMLGDDLQVFAAQEGAEITLPRPLPVPA